VLSWRLGSGPTGRRWRAVRDSELGAASAGLNVARTKLIAFSLSGALGGLSGVLSVFLIGYIAPDTYSVWLSAFLLAAIIIGGRASTLGSLLGAPFIVAIPFLTSTAAIWSQVFFGISVLATLLLFPNGIAHLAVLLRPARAAATPPSTGSSAAAPVSPAASTAKPSAAR
jgi:branched-chain amino acid transport system permease protein